MNDRKKWAKLVFYTPFLERELENLEKGKVTPFLLDTLKRAYYATEYNEPDTKCGLCRRSLQPEDTEWKLF